MFHILATFTKSFDINHGSAGSAGSAGSNSFNNIHLIASTAVLAGSFDFQNIFEGFSGDFRKKKTLIIEVADITYKYNENNRLVNM